MNKSGYSAGGDEAGDLAKRKCHFGVARQCADGLTFVTFPSDYIDTSAHIYC